MVAAIILSCVLHNLDCVGHNWGVELRFTQAARRHRVGKAHVRHVVATCEPTPIVTKCGDEGWSYIGVDDRGLELEVVAVDTPEGLLVIHAMPTALRGH